MVIRLKKIRQILIIYISLLVTIPSCINASNKLSVTLNKCVDGDTAWFNLNDEVIKTRFLAIDTPESTNKIEKYGKEASKFTCDLLSNAKKIEIEYDDNSDKQDKYKRELVWIFVDGELLQEKIVENGYAEIKYIYGDYKYLNQLDKALNKAKKNKVNLWNNNVDDTNYILVGIIILIIIILFIFNKKVRRKIIRKTKREVKKTIKKALK